MTFAQGSGKEFRRVKRAAGGELVNLLAAAEAVRHPHRVFGPGADGGQQDPLRWPEMLPVSLSVFWDLVRPIGLEPITFGSGD